MNFKGESRFDAALVADAGANPASSKFAGVIEGHTEYSGCSDLSPSSICQSVPNPPMNVGNWATIGRAANALLNRSLTHCVRDSCRLSGANLPNGSMRVFHGAGTTDEENAGQHSNIATTVWWIAGSGGGKGLWQATALKQMLPHYRRNPNNPYVEKEARLRPQPFISSRSRMGTSIRCSCEGGSRGPASALRFTFGSEETRHANAEKSIGLGTIGFCATSLLNLL